VLEGPTVGDRVLVAAQPDGERPQVRQILGRLDCLQLGFQAVTAQAEHHVGERGHQLGGAAQARAGGPDPFELGGSAGAAA